MRFVIAVMRHETNTFSPLPTVLEDFGRGMSGGPSTGAEAVRAMAGTNNPIAAFLDIARARGAEAVVPIAANASPSGKVTDDAFEAIAGRILAAIGDGCDAALLDLHGAMVTESFDDGEGELLRRIRELAPGLPVAVALDFHTNLTAAMMDNADVITGYRTYPHVDMYETGERAGRTLMRMLDGEVRPVMAWKSLPMLTHMLRQTPSTQPMKDIMDRAIAAEAGGEVLNASLFGGFPLADIPHVGLSAVVVSDGDAHAAEDLRDELLRTAWTRRADFVFPLEPMADSIARAAAMTEGPVVLADHGDNTGAGGNQDVMAVLAEVMRQDLPDVAAGPFWDPEAVARMHAAGVGAELTLSIGGRTDMPALGLKGEPLQVTGRVKTLSDGRFTVTGPMMTGMELGIGRTAVLETAHVEILVSERRMEPFDLGIFTHAGIDPRSKRYILIKSRQHFRAGFEPIAKEIVLVAGPGVCSSDYDLFPFRNLRRPIYPLDEDLQAM
ncbi:M81 family metallopeptidase [Marinibaculum pumilum]|uniref:Microcystinase C n=1 Tax=Marinibaculum pumilum TaxID=1766165 RepID=A0ABV7L9I3_9PROT